MSNSNRAVLIILDGWGAGNPDDPHNAIARTPTPTFDKLYKGFPNSLIRTHGKYVGLPEGQMGNSEVGHMNIGAGRIVRQGLTLISGALEDGTFFENPALTKLTEDTRQAKGALHLMGLFSDGGVHSHYDHAKALVHMAKQRGLNRVYIHAFLDGRDTPPRSALDYIDDFEEFVAREKLGAIATVAGRYYAMDRDKRWDRTEKAYNAMVLGMADHVATSAREAVEMAYRRGENDEFVLPTVICNGKKNAVGTITDRDGVVFFNFRADRARQMTRALTDPSFNDFNRQLTPKLSGFVCFTEYDERFDLPVAFRSQAPKGTLGEVVANAGLKQLRIAETEKYAHVTFFFNGGEEKVFEGEERILVPSPREVPTYDHKPQMSARELTEKCVADIEAEKHDLIVLNFANGDMVGHTGIMEAAQEAVKVIDECVGKIVEAAQKHGYSVLITADHGNCEEMADQEGSPITKHSTNLVPAILVSDRFKNARLRSGRLADIAPTILEVMDLPRPSEMNGESLIER